MKISVIVTTYNRPDALKKVIQGLLSQTQLPCEIIIADDGSSKETMHLINELATSSILCPVIHVWQEDKGFRAARIRNFAIKKSTGEYIVSLDGDCIPDKYFIEDHLKLAKPGFFKKDLYSVNGFNQDFIGWGREDSELAIRLYNLGLQRREHPFMDINSNLWHVKMTGYACI